MNQYENGEQEALIGRLKKISAVLSAFTLLGAIMLFVLQVLL